MGIEEKIKDIEDEIQKTPYNKATSHHIGKLKAKLSKLKEESIQRSSSGTKGQGFHVKKSGDATVVLVGFPSVGKSTLLNELTNAESKVGAYQFTTLDIVPGVMEYKNAKIQVFDIPGIITGASTGKGRGREILSVARTAELIVVVLDVLNPQHLDVILKELKTTINPVAFVVDILPTPENVCYLRSITKYEQLKDPAGTLSKLLDNFYDDKDFKDKKNIFIKPRLNTFILKKQDNSMLPFDPDISEIIGELLWYGQVLYTNGLIWKYFKITKLNYSDESNNLNLIELRKKLLHDKSFVFENLAFEIDVAEIADFTDKYPNSEVASTEWNKLIDALAKIDWRQDPTVTIN